MTFERPCAFLRGRKVNRGVDDLSPFVSQSVSFSRVFSGGVISIRSE